MLILMFGRDNHSILLFGSFFIEGGCVCVWGGGPDTSLQYAYFIWYMSSIILVYL